MEAVATEAGVGKPVLYTVFRTRTELVAALLDREHRRALQQVLAAMPKDLSRLGPGPSYAATIADFVGAVLDSPVRWSLILTAPDAAPQEYRTELRKSRGQVLQHAVLLARAGIALEPRLARLDPDLLGHSMLSLAEMLGRLAISSPEAYPRERLIKYAESLSAVMTGSSTA